jgi:hypothetical protein
VVDLNFLPDNYQNSYDYLVNQNGVAIENSWDGFPVAELDISARELDLISQQIGHCPTKSPTSANISATRFLR